MNKIPKRIFQTFITKISSKPFQDIIDLWKINNPGYEYTFYDDAACEEFLLKNFPENVLTAYERIVPGAYKKDLWRYCILYIYGGVYIDIDTYSTGRIDDFIDPEIEFMTPVDLNLGNGGYHNLFNSFIASVPKHKILEYCIKRIVHNVETNTIPSSKLDFSGPGVLGRSVNLFLNRGETDSFIGFDLGNHYMNIKFLTFDATNEQVSKYEKVLFQNKNKNSTIINFYNYELQKNKAINWVTCTNVIKPI